MHIGFIGMGIMGSRMAMNLLKAGHDLTISNRTREKAQILLDKRRKMGRISCSKEAQPCKLWPGKLWLVIFSKRIAGVVKDYQKNSAWRKTLEISRRKIMNFMPHFYFL